VIASLCYEQLLPVGSESVADIIHLMRQFSVDILMLWVPGHCGLPGSELTDQQA